ncbi:MAG: CRISPR-associated endonuclease Cas1, partial [Paludibacteraceae bacterium]|nr:CRISPR-associated endonuclease Cas1 [Paludibacteraceae bacterium]
MIKRVLCFENPAQLSLKLQQLVVKRGEETLSLPIEDIGVVILDHKQITITHALIGALLANNVAIVTSDDKHLPVGLMLPLDGHNLQSERFREQIEAS